MMPSREILQTPRDRLVNFIVFQATWFGSVWSAASGHAAWALLIPLVAVGVHLAMDGRRLRETGTIAAVTAIGFAWDSLLAFSGLIDYRGHGAIDGLAPLWIAGLWASFATTLDSSLGWLQGRPALAIAFGAAGGPLAFVAAERLGAVTLVHPTAAVTALALGWAVLTPAALRCARGRWSRTSMQCRASEAPGASR